VSAEAAGDPTTGTNATVDGVPMHFVRAGNGRPACLIHGASGNLNDMTFHLGPALADRYDVIAVDRPGHGRSAPPDGGGVSINAQAALVRGALDRLGIVRPLVVGQSYGGARCGEGRIRDTVVTLSVGKCPVDALQHVS